MNVAPALPVPVNFLRTPRDISMYSLRSACLSLAHSPTGIAGNPSVGSGRASESAIASYLDHPVYCVYIQHAQN